MHKKIFSKFVRWIGYDLGISPNQITWGRLIFFIPGWLTWVYMHKLALWSGLPWQLFGSLAIALVTIVITFDIVDGALARETGQVSDQGKVIDPLVDKLITYSTLALFWPDIHKTAFAILLLLDLASTFLRGTQVEGANQFGKKKALCQNLSKFFFGVAVVAALPWLNIIGNFLIWLSVILATISVGIRILPAKTKNIIIIMIPQILTLANLAAGVGTAWCSFQAKIELGIILNFTAMAFDLIDGAVARKLGVTSNFGKYFDTAADLVSFGAGPAFLVMAANDFNALSIGLGCFYFLATCFRLYDYSRSKETTPSGFFRGLPSPAGAWLVVASLLFDLPVITLPVITLAAVLMCLFRINWIHFSRVATDMTLIEISSAIIIGLTMAFAATPTSFAAGPILVYIFSPKWRKPKVQSQQPEDSL